VGSLPATDYFNERIRATKEGSPGDIRGFDAKPAGFSGRSTSSRGRENSAKTLG
jgi:hypothetical protein